MQKIDLPRVRGDHAVAEFEVKVVRIDDVIEHPNADRLTIVKIGGYTCIANKHEDGSWRYKPGDAVVYIPENAVLPEWLLRKQDMWNEEKGMGYLAGSKGNRVKAIKLRGIFSEGILYALNDTTYSDAFEKVYALMTPTDNYGVNWGDDVTERLGITKYEPEIPTNMDGEVFYLGEPATNFDLEPWEKFTDVIPDGEIVVFMEKLHGTFTGIKIIPGLNHPDAFMAPWGSRDIVVFSKGLGKQGLVFKDNETNASNLYAQGLKTLLTDQFWVWYDSLKLNQKERLTILGETYGKGVQDLDYGATGKEYRVFVIGVESDHIMDWVGPMAVQEHAEAMGSKVAPILYTGPFDEEVLVEYRDGKTTLGGGHVREGVVIYPMIPRRHDILGPVRLKAVSPDYKLRKGGTEFN
jgi:RNA ligase (TIGR02306 family)